MPRRFVINQVPDHPSGRLVMTMSNATIPGVVLTYDASDYNFNGNLTTVPSTVLESKIEWKPLYSINYQYGHIVQYNGVSSPAPSFTVTWTIPVEVKFNPAVVTFGMTSPDRLSTSGSTNVVSISTNVYIKQYASNFTLVNYPLGIPWATSLPEETDGKHNTFKLDGKYKTSASGDASGYTVEAIIYYGYYSYNGSYNVSKNYKMYFPPRKMPNNFSGDYPIDATYIA